jgi:UMF1 family MFS transporter
LFSWCLFDWANSAFPTVIVTFLFSAYFVGAVAETPILGTAQWGTALTISGLTIAVLSPVVGAIADKHGRRKPWLFGLMAVCIPATALLWFTEPSPGYLLWALVLFAIANTAFEMAMVFYNAMLPSLAPFGRIGRLSGWAWGLGYAGGLACLLLLLAGLVDADPPPFGLDPNQAEHVRVAAPVVALWFALFSLPLFLFTPDRPRTGRGLAEAVRTGIMGLLGTLRRVRDYPDIARFLLARIFYIDGLNTLFAFGGIYAAGTFGMDLSEILQFGIALSVTAGLGAFALAWVDDLIGARRTVLISLTAIVVLGVPLLLVDSKAWFWGLALALGVFMGPAQAASRSLMARLASRGQETEMFGLYALSGKITGFLGPALFSALTLAFDSQRAGMSTVLVLIAIGAVLLVGVREPGR